MFANGEVNLQAHTLQPAGQHAQFSGQCPLSVEGLHGEQVDLLAGLGQLQAPAAALGVRAAARAPAFRVVLAYTAVFCGLIALLVATTRFRVPFAFPLTAAAGVGIDRLLARRIARRDLVALAVALLVLAWGAGPAVGVRRRR